MCIIIPDYGTIGSLRMNMFRGTGANTNHSKFASDPGDYGRGQYWTDSFDFAQKYGNVQETLIVLDDILFIPKGFLTRTIREFGTTDLSLGKSVRLSNSQRLTDHFQSIGCKGILTFDYESFGIFGLCIF